LYNASVRTAYIHLKIRLILNGREACTKIFFEYFKVFFVMRDDPSIYTGIPLCVTESQDKLDVGLVFRHAENEAAAGHFESDGIFYGVDA